MYLIRLRNHAVCLGGDPQCFVRGDLRSAILDAARVVSAGPNRAGLVLRLSPGSAPAPVLSFFSGDGDRVCYTDFERADVEARYGILGTDLGAESDRLAARGILG